MEAIKIPAIRGKIGNTVFYCTTLTFKQVSTMVKKVDNSVNPSKEYSFTDNSIQIKDCVLKCEVRFLGDIVLAVCDGNPMWKEVRVEIEDETYYNFGLLELTGQEKIFPVDGQHRVEEIKAAIQVNQELERESVGVIMIGSQNVP